MARRIVALQAAGVGALTIVLGVAGPGLLAGLSDDDPAGVTTYSILGADFGYSLLWAIPLSTALLICFHLLGVRLGIASGKGFAAVIRHRYGHSAARVVAVSFVLANFGTICAEFAGIAAAGSLWGIPPFVAAPAGAVVVAALLIAGSFHRVEHVLLSVSSLLALYIVTAFLAKPDWGAAAHGLLVPTIPSSKAALIAVTATIGTTLAPWGLAFIQSYAVDKGLTREHLMAERAEIIAGSLLTGIIGAAIAITCAAVLKPAHIHIDDAHDAALALAPLAGQHAALLFSVGLLGAALLGAAIVPLATSYTIAESFGKQSDLDDTFSHDRLFYGSFLALVVTAAAIVSLPGLPLIPLIYATQVVNAIFLPPHLIMLLHLNRDSRIVGEHRIPLWGLYVGWAGVLAVGAALIALGVVTVRG